ncbi:hypothetical protein FNAPI_3105 [Fusarium napiforme]|uniref:Uncharacterized protein n=1 Tax=Fusarium napiforme TaxID=42672 RepID=A0A8H5K0B0_9HYPO|nr:hypothetical protein FNAPI_3105 [Fusarium napiforme]
MVREKTPSACRWWKSKTHPGAGAGSITGASILFHVSPKRWTFEPAAASTLADEWTVNAGGTAGTTDEWTASTGTSGAAGITDEWNTNTAPAGEQGAKNILDPDEVGISTSRRAPGNSPANSKPAINFKEPESREE